MTGAVFIHMFVVQEVKVVFDKIVQVGADCDFAARCRLSIHNATIGHFVVPFAHLLCL